MIFVRRHRRIGLFSVLFPLLLAVSGCGGAEDDQGSGKLDQDAVAGAWRGGGGGLALFSRDGTVELSDVTCGQVSVEGSEEVSLAGKWRVRSPRGGGRPWVSLEFPAGACGAEGAWESGFYAYKGTGDLVLHLGDPDMADEDLDFHRD